MKVYRRPSHNRLLVESIAGALFPVACFLLARFA